MLLLGGQLVLQNIMTSSGMMMKVIICMFKKKKNPVRSDQMFLAVVASPLHKTLQQAVKNVAPVPHQPDVLRSAVHTLPVQNGPFKHVAELLPCAWIRIQRKELKQKLTMHLHGRKENVSAYRGSLVEQNLPCTSTRSGCSGVDSPSGPRGAWFGCSSEPVRCWRDSS